MRARSRRSALPSAPTPRGPCRPSARRAAAGAAGSPASCRPRGRAARRARAGRWRALPWRRGRSSSSTLARALEQGPVAPRRPPARRGSLPRDRLHREGDVVDHAGAAKQARDLERARQAVAGAVGASARRVMSAPAKTIRPRSLAQLAAELRHQRRLAGAVRADQRVDLAGVRRAGRRGRSRPGRRSASRGRARRAAARPRRRVMTRRRAAPRQQADDALAREQHDRRAGPSRSRTRGARSYAAEHFLQQQQHGRAERRRPRPSRRRRGSPSPSAFPTASSAAAFGLT